MNKALDDGWTPLYVASRERHAEVVELLLRKGIREGTYTLGMAERDNVVNKYRQIYGEQIRAAITLKHAKPRKNDEGELVDKDDKPVVKRVELPDPVPNKIAQYLGGKTKAKKSKKKTNKTNKKRSSRSRKRRTRRRSVNKKKK